MIVVIPTSRSVNPDYLRPLIDAGARFVVVDDSEGSVDLAHPQLTVLNWNDRRRMLGALDEHFPRRNGACRLFGFYFAWKESDPGEIVVALDDDCEVYHEDFAARVESALSASSRPVARTTDRHLNILDLYDGIPEGLFPRGFPYSSRLDYRGSELAETTESAPIFCLGLWQNVFDVNAIDKIRGPAHAHPGAALKWPSVVVARSQLVSVCSMNMQFRRELIPAVFQFPMHVELMRGWVVDRYGDVWGGFVQKLLMDIRGDALAVGEPMIRHLKEGDYLRNVWQEHLAHLLNDEMVELLVEAAEGVAAASYLDMIGAFAEEIRRRSHQRSALLRRYLESVDRTMSAWVEALS